MPTTISESTKEQKRPEKTFRIGLVQASIFPRDADAGRTFFNTVFSRSNRCLQIDLGRPFDITQPSMSKHIRVLERAGLVSRRIDGQIHRFHLMMKPLNEAQDWIATHREFWEGSLDALSELLDEMKDKADDKTISNDV